VPSGFALGAANGNKIQGNTVNFNREGIALGNCTATQNWRASSAISFSNSEARKELFYPYGKTYAQTLGEQD
jgi:parallel beta-helix repeat protein